MTAKLETHAVAVDFERFWLVPDKAKTDSKKLIDFAIPVFGSKFHVCIGCMHGLIFGQIVTDGDARPNDGLEK